MPHRFPFASPSNAPDEEMHESAGDAFQHHDPSRKRSASVLRRLHRIGDWLRRDDEERLRDHAESHHKEQKHASDDQQHLQPQQQQQQDVPAQNTDGGPIQEEQDDDDDDDEEPPGRTGSVLGRTFSKSKKVVPELPRQLTFQRMNSEKRERLMPVEPSATERRAVSADRRPRGMSSTLRRQSPSVSPLPSQSAPDVNTPDPPRPNGIGNGTESFFDRAAGALGGDDRGPLPDLPPFENAPDVTLDDDSGFLDERELQAELEAKWILNLSMQFRDKSDREKFFVTYAQEPNFWRRVTVSCDYRDAPPDSLEADLKSLRYQRDKGQRIYEAIRESLPDIQFYDTVTNLKLETEDGRLHVHVTEDANEIIPYPSTNLFQHIQCSRYRESELDFQSHLSGFVYKVSADDRIFIKKEIPGPDTVDEFLYEINALDSLRSSKSVIQLHGLVTDEDGQSVKGLLVSFASLGALIDVIYDYKFTDSLPWPRRERWAYQIIQGLSEIHEAGFVQGDFTLSNIVIDSEDDAKIIDINRRGCPIGWEPPELLHLVHSGQRISMCIGVKSDLYQLGMVLWALAENQDEPENVGKENGRMPEITSPDVPEWFRGVVDGCLSDKPQSRASAKQLLSLFPHEHVEQEGRRVTMEASDHSLASRQAHREDIDPATIVNRDDIDEFKRRQRDVNAIPISHPTTEQLQYADPATSTGYRIESNGSYILPHRGRSPYTYHRSADGRSVSSTTSISLSNEGGLRWEHICPEYAEDDDDASPAVHDRAAEERPSVPDPPPFHPRGYPEPHRGGFQNDGLEQRHHRVFFSPPVHQDSGFDEYMTESLELDNELPNSHHTTVPSHNLPPILTATAQLPDDTVYYKPALAQPSGSATVPVKLTQPRDTQTPQPQPPASPATPYHTPLTSPSEIRSGQQIAGQYLGKNCPVAERPDSKYCPDPTSPPTDLS